MNNQPKASIGVAQARPLTGIKNHGEITLECADCGKPLMRFLNTRTNAELQAMGAEPVTTKVQVQCGLCGGRSYAKTIEGCFCPGAAADDIVFDVVDSGRDDVTAFRAWGKPA